MGSNSSRLLIKIVGALGGLLILTMLVIWVLPLNLANLTQQTDSSKVLAQSGCTPTKMPINSSYSVYSSPDLQQTPIAKTLANQISVDVKRCANGWVQVQGWFKIR